MKKLLGILVLGLLWCNVANAKDLTGTKIFCSLKKELHNHAYAFEFVSTQEVRVHTVGVVSWKYKVQDTTYEVMPDKIIIEIYPISIDRETLKFGYDPCKILDKNVNLQDKMQGILDDLIKKQESKNKI